GHNQHRHQGERFGMKATKQLPLIVSPGQKDGLLHAGNLQYVGGFRVPDGRFGPDPYDEFYFSYGVIAFRSPGSLFIMGHPYVNGICEISIPAPVNSTNVGDLPTAGVLQNFANPLGNPTTGLLSSIPNDTLTAAGLNPHYLGGLQVFGSQLIGSVFV